MKSYRQKSKGFLDGYNLMGISEIPKYRNGYKSRAYKI